MPDPRLQALMGALGGGGDPSMEPMPEEEASYGQEAPATPEDAAGQCLTALEPFMDDPRIAQAASLLQEVAGGPGGMSPDTMPEEAEPML